MRKCIFTYPLVALCLLLAACDHDAARPQPEPEIKEGVYLMGYGSRYVDTTLPINYRYVTHSWHKMGKLPPFKVCVKRMPGHFIFGRFANGQCTYCAACTLEYRLVNTVYEYRSGHFAMNDLMEAEFLSFPFFYEDTWGYPYFTDSCQCVDSIVGSEFAPITKHEIAGREILMWGFTTKLIWHPMHRPDTVLAKPLKTFRDNSSAFSILELLQPLPN